MGKLILILPGALLLYSAPALGQDVESAAKIIEFFRFSGLIPALIFIVIAALLLRLVTGFTRRLGERFTKQRLLAHQIQTMVSFLVYIVTFWLVVSSVFVLEKETMLALAGTIAVSLGFAFKDLAASVLAGITILFDRPFQVGDRVTFGAHYGEITHIGLRSVRMTTLDDSVVTIPNNRFLTEVVVSGNAGQLFMQIVMDYHIAPEADVATAKRIVYEALRTSRFVYLEKPVVVLVNELITDGYVATRLRAKAYVLDMRYEKAFETDVTERVKAGFASANVRPPTVRHLGEIQTVEGAAPARN